MTLIDVFDTQNGQPVSVLYPWQNSTGVNSALALCRHRNDRSPGVSKTRDNVGVEIDAGFPVGIQRRGCNYSTIHTNGTGLINSSGTGIVCSFGGSPIPFLLVTVDKSLRRRVQGDEENQNRSD